MMTHHRSYSGVVSAMWVRELQLDGWIVGMQDESGQVSLRSRQTGQRVAVSAEPLVLATSGSVACRSVICIYFSRARRLHV